MTGHVSVVMVTELTQGDRPCQCCDGYSVDTGHVSVVMVTVLTQGDTGHVSVVMVTLLTQGDTSHVSVVMVTRLTQGDRPCQCRDGYSVDIDHNRGTRRQCQCCDGLCSHKPTPYVLAPD